jgi:hypothetical protein
MVTVKTEKWEERASYALYDYRQDLKIGGKGITASTMIISRSGGGLSKQKV